jgi:hypothetical protein
MYDLHYNIPEQEEIHEKVQLLHRVHYTEFSNHKETKANHERLELLSLLLFYPEKLWLRVIVEKIHIDAPSHTEGFLQKWI